MHACKFSPAGEKGVRCGGTPARHPFLNLVRALFMLDCIGSEDYCGPPLSRQDALRETRWHHD